MEDTITIRTDFDVDLITSAGSDELICRAARVSTLGAASIDTEESAGLIRYLMSNRHGTPFEHSMLMFRISAPIVVWREFMRHRIGISYNEQSGRYMKLEPVFYLPPTSRNLVQVGKPGHYEYIPGTPEQYAVTQRALVDSYRVAWASYEHQMDMGVAKEVARMCLPLSVYSTAYVTLNPRSLMHFLSLRTKDDGALFRSFPMWEINKVADQMEKFFKELFPITHEAFITARRVAP